MLQMLRLGTERSCFKRDFRLFSNITLIHLSGIPLERDLTEKDHHIHLSGSFTILLFFLGFRCNISFWPLRGPSFECSVHVLSHNQHKNSHNRLVILPLVSNCGKLVHFHNIFHLKISLFYIKLLRFW